MAEVLVRKKNGQTEEFSEEKVLRSMHRVGIPKNLQNDVLLSIKDKLYSGISTKEIFSHILEFVKEKDKRATIRFNLKQSLFDLGPTGFPFEQYMSHVFSHMGFKTTTNIIMQGDCVTHEIDLVIEKDGKRAIVEAKFHNQPGSKTDVHVAMYMYARFLDVKEKNTIDNVWIVTNTKLTEDAISYARCKGVQTIGWSYPREGNLQDLIEEPSLYPITILTMLSDEDKRQLMNNNLVLCRDFARLSSDDAKDFFIAPERFQKAHEDARMVCAINKSKLKTAV